MQALWTKITSSLLALSAILANAASAEDLQVATYFQSQNQFAHQLLEKTISEAEKNENVFLSPLSANLALSMLLEGARGSTRTAMLTGLGLPPSVNVSDLHQRNADYVESLLQSSDDLTIDINNAIWADNSFPLMPSFVDSLASFYQAKVENVDFKQNTAEVTEKINQWALDSTNDKIRHVIDVQDAGDLEMLLANATYFKGSWKQEFAKDRTKAMAFQTENGESNVQTMFGKIEADYCEAGYKAIRLPYKGDTVSMYVILPPERLSPREWTRTTVLNHEFWENLDAEMRQAKVQLLLPKFRLKSSKVLNSTLAAMGFAKLFANPDLSGLSYVDSRVSFVKQDTFVQVDEEGTEAAAVTTIGIERTATLPSKEMRVDRPFFVAIRDNVNKSFLFMGYIANPQWQ